ncbi:MAG: F0F1 ATP synthase subunit B [Clostridiales bacterium]|nr:F0F1 ATP synthase subunit B [Clostridiales bacterium]
MEGFDIRNLPMDLILNILNIVLLFVIVRALVWKPVKKFLDARNEKLKKAAESAAADKAEALETKSKYEALIADIEKTAAETEEKAKKEAGMQAEKIIADAEKKAEDIKSDALKSAEDEKTRALENMRSDVVDLAFSISEKLIERNIKDGDNMKIAEKFFDEHLSEGE